MSEGFLPVGDVAAFHEVMPRSFEMAQPPRFAFGTFPSDIASLFYGTHNLAPVGVYAGPGFELSDGYTLHHGGRLVVAPDLKLFPKHLGGIDPAHEARFATRPRRRLPGKAALIVSPGYMIYGHWLAEILPRLGVLHAAGHDIAKLVFPVPADAPKYGPELMRLFGVPASQILVYQADEVVCPDEALMPTLMHNGIRYSPVLADTVALFKRGLAKAGHSLVSRGTPARVFLTRAGGNRRLENRAAIQKMAEAAGFILLRPETFSLPEQFALFANVREVAGEYGSAFHTALFSPPGTIVCGLRGSRGHPGFLQSGMGDVLGHHTGYVFGQTGESANVHDYSVPESVFADCLRSVFSPLANLGPRMVPAPASPPVAAVEVQEAPRRRWPWQRRARDVAGGYTSLFGAD